MREIKTERLILKEIEDKDKDALINIFTNPLVSKTYMIPAFSNMDEKIKFFERLKNVTKSERIAFGIYYNEVIIGFINEVVKDGKAIEVGYFIDPTHWNKGFATEAFGAMIKYLFENGFDKVEAGFFEGNHASEKVMIKCGLKKEDKVDFIEYKGKMNKCIYYSITKA